MWVLNLLWGVYPRPRGGTLPCVMGTPPFFGSIPAHAGEPPSMQPRSSLNRVYPRPRGGTPHPLVLTLLLLGLSPPTRGNLGCEAPLRRGGGSIPAHAGEPSTNPRTSHATPVYPRPRGEPPFAHCLLSENRVYPRPRGGTASSSPYLMLRKGLSPPTRGNRETGRHEPARLGSIPAHAGEPAQPNLRLL